MEQFDERTSNQFSKRMLFLLIALCMVAFVLSLLMGGCTVSQKSSEAKKIETLEASDTPYVPEASDSGKSLTNPIDFAALQEQNQDVYAWIYVPDTKVNYPVLQNSYADNYYLVHNMFYEESVEGALYTQSMNSLDFTDPVTVIYGHTFEVWQEDLADLMFGTLHNFEDAGFFDSHPYFYIYTPYKVLTYLVVSAYEYDDRHIMNSFDFSDPEVVQQYFDYVVNPDSMVKNVRQGVTLSADESKIVQLSTCTRPANDAARYLVTGVLIDEQDIG